MTSRGQLRRLAVQAGQSSPESPGAVHPSAPGTDGTQAGPLAPACLATEPVGTGDRGASPGTPVPGDFPPVPSTAGGKAVPPLSKAPVSGGGAAPDPGGEARMRTAAFPPGTTPLAGRDFRDAWKSARSQDAKAARNRRGRQRKQPGYQPGMTRRLPPGGDAA